MAPARFGPAAVERMVDLGEVTCRVVEQGSGPPILFIPGGDYKAELYLEQVNALSDQYRCIVFDPRGVGQTKSPSPPWTMADFAADCASLIRHLDLEKTFLCGMSMGAQIVLQTTIDYPDLVRVAIPIASPAHLGPGFAMDMMNAEIELRRTGVTLPAIYQALHFAAMYYPSSALSDPDLWNQIKAELMEQFDGRSADQLIAQWQPCLGFDCREELRTCCVPIHVIAFEQDLMTPPSECRGVSDLAPRGAFHVLEDMGHASMRLHRPERLTKKIVEILSACNA